LKLSFSSPRENRIVILYDHDFWIRKLILREIPATTLALNPLILEITPLLILRTFLRFRAIRWREIRASRFLMDLIKQVYGAYILACLDQTRAEVVLTAIDNSGFFHRLTRLDGERTYFAIQNGTRMLGCFTEAVDQAPESTARISMTNLFCFGHRDVDLYAKYNLRIDNCFPIGSLIGGCYKSGSAKDASVPTSDLCLISQWHEHFFGEITGDDYTARQSRRTGAAIRALNSFVIRVVHEFGLRMTVCLRHDGDEQERAFYQETIGNDVRLIDYDRAEFSTYRMVEQSRLVIGLSSTLLAEVFSWGRKVLWCNIPDDPYYAMPEAGISYFCGDSYDAFKERVSTLLDLSQEDYGTRTHEAARYINNFDPARPPQEVIRTKIMEVLNGPS